MIHWLLTRLIRLPQFKGKHRLVRLVRSVTVAPFRCKASRDLTLELDCYEWAQLYLIENGTTEPQTMALIERLLKPGDTYIDVGAHIGFVSLVARGAVGNSGRVIAIEPQPYNGEKILRNWELNGFQNLSLHVAAAGDQNGFVELAQQTATDKSRLSLEVEMADALDLKFTVPIITLSSLMQREKVASVALVKIDVEGFELKVLQGMVDRLADVRNIVFEALSEVEGDRERNTHVVDFLKQHGFHVRRIDGEAFTGDYPVLEGNLWASQI